MKLSTIILAVCFALTPFAAHATAQHRRVYSSCAAGAAIRDPDGRDRSRSSRQGRRRFRRVVAQSRGLQSRLHRQQLMTLTRGAPDRPEARRGGFSGGGGFGRHCCFGGDGRLMTGQSTPRWAEPAVTGEVFSPGRVRLTSRFCGAGKNRHRAARPRRGAGELRDSAGRDGLNRLRAVRPTRELRCGAAYRRARCRSQANGPPLGVDCPSSVPLTSMKITASREREIGFTTHPGMDRRPNRTSRWARADVP